METLMSEQIYPPCKVDAVLFWIGVLLTGLGTGCIFFILFAMASSFIRGLSNNDQHEFAIICLFTLITMSLGIILMVKYIKKLEATKLRDE